VPPLCEKMIRAQIDPIMHVYGEHITFEEHLDHRLSTVDNRVKLDMVKLPERGMGYVFNVHEFGCIVKYTGLWKDCVFMTTAIEIVGRDLGYVELAEVSAILTVEIYRIFKTHGWANPENMMQTVGY